MSYLTKITTYLPAFGFLGLALYQACNQHDLMSAGQSIGSAVTIFGFSTLLHANAPAAK